MHFSVAFGAMLLFTFIMGLQAKNFYTQHVVLRKFSSLDLQFPASGLELVNYITGIFKLPASLAAKVLKNLRGQLIIDFFFMVSAYGSIFILCMKVSMKMTSFGHNLFAIFAWMQIIPFLFDIIENVYLLRKIKPNPEVSGELVHKTMEILAFSKWIIALTAVVCCIASMCYFWLVGRFSYNSLEYLLLIISELAIFMILKKATSYTDKEKFVAFKQ